MNWLLLACQSTPGLLATEWAACCLTGRAVFCQTYLVEPFTTQAGYFVARPRPPVGRGYERCMNAFRIRMIDQLPERVKRRDLSHWRQGMSGDAAA